MLAARRTAIAAPAFTRRCAFLTKMKAMEAETDKLSKTLPDGLKEIAQSGTQIHADLKKFASDRPELFKAVVAKIAEADKPGIVATTPEPRDPKACKYTEEGTLLHEMMQRVYTSDRRMAALSSLEVTLTAADKESIKSAITTKATEKGMDGSSIKDLLGKIAIPDKMTVEKMMS